MDCKLCDWKDYCIPDECPGYAHDEEENLCEYMPHRCCECDENFNCTLNN